MRCIRQLAVTVAVVAAAAALTACKQAAGEADVDGGAGSDPAAACQKLITNSEVASTTGVADLAYDPTGSAVTLDNVRICPYQNSAGLEVIATVYSGSGYTDGFKMSFQIAKDSPNPADVPGLGHPAVWISNSDELFVDLGSKGIQVSFLNKGIGNPDFADAKGKSIAIAKVVMGRV
jgi:hypothetical protein